MDKLTVLIWTTIENKLHNFHTIVCGQCGCLEHWKGYNSIYSDDRTFVYLRYKFWDAKVHWGQKDPGYERVSFEWCILKGDCPNWVNLP